MLWASVLFHTIYARLHFFVSPSAFLIDLVDSMYKVSVVHPFRHCSYVFVLPTIQLFSPGHESSNILYNLFREKPHSWVSRVWGGGKSRKVLAILERVRIKKTAFSYGKHARFEYVNEFWETKDVSVDTEKQGL